MFSRFFGKRDKSADSPTKEAQSTRGPAVEDRLDASWGRLERMAAQDSRLPRQDLAGAAVTPKSAGPVLRSPAPAASAPLRTPPAPVSDFPADHQIDFVLPTVPAPFETELTLEQRKNIALGTVELHHQRIANTIRTLWGYRECSVYINKLIMAGGDGMGHARVGFNQDAVEAMLALSDIHDAEFGPPSTLGGALGLSL